MRIATFNLESLDGSSTSDVPAEARIDMLRPQLLRLDADILCLQEVNGQRVPGRPNRTLGALEKLLEGTPYARFNIISTTGPDGAGVADVHNLVTLSRLPIVAHRELRNTLMPPLRYRMLNACPPAIEAIAVTFDRPVLLTTHMLADGSLLTVINVHLRSPLATPIPGQKESPFVWRSVPGWAEGFFLSSLKRSAQALEIRQCIDQLLDADPVSSILVLGDFNAADHETPLRILVGAEDDTGNGRLGPRAFVVLDRNIPEDRRFTVLHHGRPEMLDHILASRTALACFRSIEAHNETLTDETVGYGKTSHAAGSYHAPVVAEIALD